MSAKHTPGPWEVTTGCFQEASRMSDGMVSCRVSYSLNAINQRGLDAPLNATLIAAAPELLEALEELMQVVEAYIDTENVAIGDISHGVTIARAAIRKATGSL